MCAPDNIIIAITPTCVKFSVVLNLLLLLGPDDHDTTYSCREHPGDRLSAGANLFDRSGDIAK